VKEVAGNVEKGRMRWVPVWLAKSTKTHPTSSPNSQSHLHNWDCLGEWYGFIVQGNFNIELL